MAAESIVRDPLAKCLQIDSGEFEGWYRLQNERFNDNVGPFQHRWISDGSVCCAFRARPKNLNGDGLVHGGSLMTLADYCMYVVSAAACKTAVVTVSMNSDFLGAARLGELIEARGAVTTVGRSLVFAHGIMKTDTRHILNFSGVFKRLRSERDISA